MEKAVAQFLVLFILNSTTFSQPFLKFAGTTRGLELSLGAMTADGGLETTISYKTSLTQNDKPKILSLSVGKQILVTNNEEDNYSITPSIGYGYLRWKDYTGFYAQPPAGPAPGPLPSELPPTIIDDGIITITEHKPLFALELGKDSYLGRIGITAAWCKDFYFGVNLRFFPYRNNR